MPIGQKPHPTKFMGTKATDATEILYRQWEDVSGAGVNKHQQLVIPREVAPKVLSDLHNSPAGGHLGACVALLDVESLYYFCTSSLMINLENPASCFSE